MSNKEVNICAVQVPYPGEGVGWGGEVICIFLRGEGCDFNCYQVMSTAGRWA